MTTKSDNQKKPRTRRAQAHIWHLISNHQNMLYMLAAGMVMGPAGFRGKHYSDPLDVFPGWIPLFRNNVEIPAEYLIYATSERKHLLPCIASFDLKDLTGPCKMLSKDGTLRNVSTPAARKRKNDIALLVPAPLSLNLLLTINFHSSEDEQSFVRAANDVSNVDLSPYLMEVKQSLFISNADKVVWPEEPPQESLLSSDGGYDVYPAFEQALGGALAMLYQTANCSELGAAVYRVITGVAQGKDKHSVKSDPILAELPRWMEKGEISKQADIRALLFWGVIQTLVTAQIKQSKRPPIDSVLEFLEKQLAQLPEEKFRPRLEQLITDMRGSLGLGGGTITELLARNNGSFSRPLLLFCLREHCIDLLEFSHPLLTDAEYILAGILFGVRESWLQIPKELRATGMSTYVTYRMTCAEPLTHSEDMVAHVPARPVPLREYFTSIKGEWNENRGYLSVAADLASECSWDDCIQTRVTLLGSDIPENFERIGSELVLPGRVTTCETIDEDKFLWHLGNSPQLPSHIEFDIRERLVSLQEREDMVRVNSTLCE